MKTKCLLPILCSAALAFNFHALADDDGGDTNQCDIQGIEVMEGFVVLSPTTNAPSNATGVAKIDSDNEDGSESIGSVFGRKQIPRQLNLHQAAVQIVLAKGEFVSRE